jgi:hypothetical protein
MRSRITLGSSLRSMAPVISLRSFAKVVRARPRAAEPHYTQRDQWWLLG